VIYKGYLYSTLADVPVDVYQNILQSNDLYVPFGWALADNNADSIAVTASHSWSTQFLVLSDGNEYWTQTGPSNGYTAGSYFKCCQLSQSGSAYNVIECYAQILISSKGLIIYI
jgi:hypothetical protein